MHEEGVPRWLSPTYRTPPDRQAVKARASQPWFFNSRRCEDDYLFVIAIWLFKDWPGLTAGFAGSRVVVGFPVLCLGLGLLVASGVSKNGLLSRFPVPGAKVLATLAFSFYLTHKQVANLDRIYLSSLIAGRGVEAMLVYGVSCTAVAGLLYLCIERPFLMLRGRLEGGQVKTIEDQMRNEPAS
jgi:peptidoglycan/LPS O-acetylase OafA/YrhL